MRHGRLLELIWQGDVQPATGPSARRLRRTLGALLPLRMVSLAAATGVERNCIMPDDTALLADLPLGDVLTQELSIDVPAGALVVISNLDLLSGPMPDDELSYDLGVLIAKTLLGVIRSGIFSLARETDALYTMASSYHGMIGCTGFMHLGLVPAQFRAGLAAGLCTYWAGARSARSDTSGLFLRSDFLTSERLRAYLRQLDANFRAPARIPARVMLFNGGPCSYDAWLAMVEQAVMTELNSRVPRTCDGGSTQELRA